MICSSREGGPRTAMPIRFASTPRATAAGSPGSQQRGELDQDEAAGARATQARVVAYIADLQQLNGKQTVLNRVQELRNVLAVIAPEADWSWINRLATCIRARPDDPEPQARAAALVRAALCPGSSPDAGGRGGREHPSSATRDALSRRPDHRAAGGAAAPPQELVRASPRPSPRPSWRDPLDRHPRRGDQEWSADRGAAARRAQPGDGAIPPRIPAGAGARQKPRLPLGIVTRQAHARGLGILPGSKNHQGDVRRPDQSSPVSRRRRDDAGDRGSGARPHRLADARTQLCSRHRTSL